MWEAVGLGIIQGVTEFLPVSSSGHLILAPKIFGWADPGLAFDAIIHLATAIAVIVVLRKEIWGLFTGFLGWGAEEEKQKNRKLLGLIVLASLPVSIVGLLLETAIENYFRSATVVAWALIIGAVFLWVADRYALKKDKKIESLEGINYKQTLLVGACQVGALIPGVSRSAVTIMSGLFAKLNRETAVKFSFLAGLPAVIGAGIWGLIKVFEDTAPGGGLMNLSGGFLAALISGMWAIKLLLLLAKKSNFNIFVIYRIILGIIIILIF